MNLTHDESQPPFEYACHEGQLRAAQHPVGGARRRGAAESRFQGRQGSLMPARDRARARRDIGGIFRSGQSSDRCGGSQRSPSARPTAPRTRPLKSLKARQRVAERPARKHVRMRDRAQIVSEPEPARADSPSWRSPKHTRRSLRKSSHRAFCGGWGIGAPRADARRLERGTLRSRSARARLQARIAAMAARSLRSRTPRPSPRRARSRLPRFRGSRERRARVVRGARRPVAPSPPRASRPRRHRAEVAACVPRPSSSPRRRRPRRPRTAASVDRAATPRRLARRGRVPDPAETSRKVSVGANFDRLRRSRNFFSSARSRRDEQAPGNSTVRSASGLCTARHCVGARRRQPRVGAPSREAGFVQANLEARVVRVQDVQLVRAQLFSMRDDCSQPDVARREQRARGPFGQGANSRHQLGRPSSAWTSACANREAVARPGRLSTTTDDTPR